MTTGSLEMHIHQHVLRVFRLRTIREQVEIDPLVQTCTEARRFINAIGNEPSLLRWIAVKWTPTGT